MPKDELVMEVSMSHDSRPLFGHQLYQARLEFARTLSNIEEKHKVRISGSSETERGCGAHGAMKWLRSV